MAEIKLEGVGVALATPFNKDLSVDYVSLGKLIHHVMEEGCDYLVVLGTTAETPTLFEEEKILITDFIRRETKGNIPLIIGIGGNNTQAVINDINKRNLEGYSAILSVTPYYNKPTQEGLFLHYKAIAESSPLPIILYNVPGRTGVNLTAETTLRLANLNDKIIGIKEASGNIEQCKKIIKEAPVSFSLISGDDSLIAPLLKIGAKGVISVLANALPSYVKQVIALYKKGNLEDCIALQENLNPLIRLLFEDGNPSGIKTLLSMIDIGINTVRLPLTPVGKNVANKMKMELNRFPLIK